MNTLCIWLDPKFQIEFVKGSILHDAIRGADLQPRLKVQLRKLNCAFNEPETFWCGNEIKKDEILRKLIILQFALRLSEE